MTDITIVQGILAAAATLQEPFHLNDLIVAAWKRDKQAHGLAGFEPFYPDSNKLSLAVMGARGLVHKGFLDKVKPKTYRLTPLGKREAALAKAGERRAVVSRLTPGQEAHLCAMVSSIAYSRFRSGMTDAISADLARAFLDHRPGETVKAARLIVGNGSIRVNGGSIEAGHLDQIQACAKALVALLGNKLRRTAAVGV